MVYVVAGGLKASVWADLLQGSALILGGAIIMYLAFGQASARRRPPPTDRRRRHR